MLSTKRVGLCTRVTYKRLSRKTQISTLCLKTVPTFKLSATLSNLNRFSKFCTAGKRIKFATKSIRHYHIVSIEHVPYEVRLYKYNTTKYLGTFRTPSRNHIIGEHASCPLGFNAYVHIVTVVLFVSVCKHVLCHVVSNKTDLC